MAAAIARIVVQATAEEKKAIAAKAKRLGLPVSELMRRGATASVGPTSATGAGAVPAHPPPQSDCAGLQWRDRGRLERAVRRPGERPRPGR